jgi:hypothetical protein
MRTRNDGRQEHRASSMTTAAIAAPASNVKPYPIMSTISCLGSVRLRAFRLGAPGCYDYGYRQGRPQVYQTTASTTTTAVASRSSPAGPTHSRDSVSGARDGYSADRTATTVVA